MTKINCDIAIVGSGFGGTLLALIARRLGRSVALLERGKHPRFAIGESSTPLADFKLARIADRFRLDWLKPFAKYGAWKETYPDVHCGLKRGFSFFRHRSGQIFAPSPGNENALLVAASPNDAVADTHWFRADFDAFLVDRAVADGVLYVDNLDIQEVKREAGWRLRGVRDESEVSVTAKFTVDATGDGRLLGQTLGLQSVPAADLRTRSRALYSHFTNVARWHDVLRETHGDSATAEHPFPCDAAALHQIIDGGWMWVLRFDHGITSAGFSLDPEVHPVRSGEAPEAEWRRLLDAYPSIARQFARAEPVRPFVRTGRLQRRFTQASGADWAMLPHAAGFLDAWLSPGIAQTLYGVERLSRLFAEDWQSPRFAKNAMRYGEAVLRESAWVDELTGACFACNDRFAVMNSVAMLYFVAAIFCEERERSDMAPPDADFLLADEAEYRAIAAKVCAAAARTSDADAGRLRDIVRELLEPYNRCGLCDSARRNMYPYISAAAQSSKLKNQ